jgi:hypothetical protein
MDASRDTARSSRPPPRTPQPEWPWRVRTAESCSDRCPDCGEWIEAEDVKAYPEFGPGSPQPSESGGWLRHRDRHHLAAQRHRPLPQRLPRGRKARVMQLARRRVEHRGLSHSCDGGRQGAECTFPLPRAGEHTFVTSEGSPTARFDRAINGSVCSDASARLSFPATTATGTSPPPDRRVAFAPGPGGCCQIRDRGASLLADLAPCKGFVRRLR